MGDDKRPPKSRTGTPRDRDVFVPKRGTSPYGVASVPVTPPPRSPSQSEDWETPDTGAHAIEIERRAGLDNDTPIGLEVADASAESRLRARVKETNTNVKAVKTATESASVGVTTLRTEMVGHVERLEQKIVEVKSETTKELGALSGKVDDLGGHVIAAMGTVNAAVVSLNQFQGVVVENQMERSRISFEAHAKEAVIEQTDRADAKQQRRSFGYRVGALILKILGAGGVVAATAIATHYAERC